MNKQPLPKQVGDIDNLKTNDKTSVVNAVNEHETKIKDTKLQSLLLTPIDIEGATLGNIRLPENPIIIPNTITLG